jgi:hypothetical protein
MPNGSSLPAVENCTRPKAALVLLFAADRRVHHSQPHKKSLKIYDIRLASKPPRKFHNSSLPHATRLMLARLACVAALLLGLCRVQSVDRGKFRTCHDTGLAQVKHLITYSPSLHTEEGRTIVEHSSARAEAI